MNCRKLLLTACFLIYLIGAYAQRNPNKEILVFFNEGVSQEIKFKKGISTKTSRIHKIKLKSSLAEIGLTDTLLIPALPRFNKKDTLKLLSKGIKLKQPDMTKLFRIKVPKGKSRKEIIEHLNTLPEVLYAEPNGKVTPNVLPNDTRFNDQWGLRNTTNPGADIHATAAWDIYTGDSNNIIAIIDGGTDSSHEDLNNKVAGGDSGYGWSGHGIHVSGIAAAESNNNQGVSGVDWNALLHNQRIDNVSDDADTYQAIVDAVNYSENVHVLNNSWSLVNADKSPGRNSTTIRQAFAYAYKANRTSVAAMGNHQTTHPDVVQYPAGFENVISVGATDDNDQIAAFSVHGNNIDVSAPGVNILSTHLSGGYGYLSGTSMATPFVSGLASLLKGYNPDLDNDDIKNIIELSADDRGDQGYDTEFGFGRINAERALNFLKAPYTLSQWASTGGNIVNSTSQFSMIFMGTPGLASSTYLVKRHEVQKDVQFPQNCYDIIGVWGRGVKTLGYNFSNPNFGEGFCELVPGTQNDNSVTLRTYVYEIWSITGAYIGYYPTSPSNVNFAYSVLGILSPTLSGSDLVCSSGTTFSLNDLQLNTTVSWSSSSNISFPSGNTGSSVSAKASSSTVSGNGWIEATLTSSNGSFTLPRKDVWVGRTKVPNYSVVSKQVTVLTDPISIGDCDDIAIKLNIQPENYEHVIWDKVSSNYTISEKGNQYAILAPFSNGDLKLRVQVRNQCGLSNWIYHNVDNTCDSGGPFYSVYPNPANQYTELNFYESGELSKYQKNSPTMVSIPLNEQAQKLGEYEIQIWSERKGLVKKLKSKDKKLQIKTNNLDEGLYFLHVIVNGRVYKQKLRVER